MYTILAAPIASPPATALKNFKNRFEIGNNCYPVSRRDSRRITPAFPLTDGLDSGGNMASQITSDPISSQPIGSPHDTVELMRDFETYRPSVDELWRQFKH